MKLKGKCIEKKKFRYKTFRLYIIIIKVLKIRFKQNESKRITLAKRKKKLKFIKEKSTKFT